MRSIHQLLARVASGPLRLPWQLAGICWLVLVVYLSLIPEPPDLTTPINHGDKLGHLLAYLWLAAWHTLLYPQQPKSQASVAIALILLGVVLETLQGVGGVRLFEWGDMAANSCGVILGWYGSTRLLRAEADR